MFARHSRFLYELALAAALLLSSAIVVAVADNRALGVMGALCAAGLLVAGRLGLSRRQTTVLAVGFGSIIWIVGIFGEVAPPKVASTIAHLVGGALVGWALARLLRRRTHGVTLVALMAASLGLLLVVGMVWELGEAAADRLLDTNLTPNQIETVIDLAANLIGGVAGVLLAWRHRRRRGGRDPIRPGRPPTAAPAEVRPEVP